MPNTHLNARNSALLYVLLGLVGLLYILAFLRVQAQPWSSALKKHQQAEAAVLLKKEKAHTLATPTKSQTPNAQS
jgi:hypothetical protein